MELLKNILIVFAVVFGFCLLLIGAFVFFPMLLGNEIGTALAFSFFISLLAGIAVGYAKTYS